MPVEKVTEQSADPTVADRWLIGVSRPRLEYFRPWQPNGAAIMIIPGGGYHLEAFDLEGYQIADWFARRGFAAFVLIYRLPYDGWAAGPDVCLSDAQRAIRLIRHRHAHFGIDPSRVAAMGFSAGGHLCADLATRFHAPTYRAIDEVDNLSARPFVAAPLYPVIAMSGPFVNAGSRRNLLGAGAAPALEAAHQPDKNVTVETPPCFLCQAEDDPVVPVENSLMLRAALKAHKVPVTTHLFEHGGHGFGIRHTIGKPIGIWPDLFLNWARAQQLA